MDSWTFPLYNDTKHVYILLKVFHLLTILKCLLVYCVYKTNGKRPTNFVQIRSYIKVRCEHHLCLKNIYDELFVVYGPNEVLYTAITRWFQQCERGQGSFKYAKNWVAIVYVVNKSNIALMLQSLFNMHDS